MVEIELADGQIVNIAATTFWGPDGKPMSAKKFIQRTFGELPDSFKDQDELRILWSDSDTRKALIERLAERGYDALVLMRIRAAIMAKKCDLFDVIAYIAYAKTPISRAERAGMSIPEQKGSIRRSKSGLDYDKKLAAILNYILGKYVETGVEDLDGSK